MPVVLPVRLSSAYQAFVVLLCGLLLSACGGSGGSAAPVSGSSNIPIGSTGFKLSSSVGTISNVKVGTVPSYAPTGYSYPAGYFTFTVSGLSAGGSATITISSPSGTNPVAYIRCNQTQSSCQPYSKATVNGTDLSLSLSDGSSASGDDDGLVNNSITDTGAVAVAINTSATPYYMPFAASGASTGLFVVPSNQLAATPQYVTSSQPSLTYAQVNQLLTNSNGQVYEELPSQLVYLAPGGSSGSQFYKLDLSSGSNLKPAQVSSYSDSPGSTCNGLFEDQEDLTDPTTAFFIFTTKGTDGSCGSSDDVAYLFHLSDSSTTAPEQLPISSTDNLVTFFNNNQLAGIMAVDTSSNLNFYTSFSFNSGSKLLSNVASIKIVHATFSYALIQVKFTNGTSSLYRITSDGVKSSDLYDFQTNGEASAGGVLDPTKSCLFFGDNAVPDANSPQVFNDILLSVAVDGTTKAQAITTFTPQSNVTYTVSATLQLNDFVGDSLMFELEADTPTVGNPAYLYTISSSATAGTNPTQIASLANGYFGYNVVANSQFFTNAQAYDGSGNISDIVAEVLQANGQAIKTFDKSEFSGFAELRGGTPQDSSFTVSDVMLLRGYTAAQSGATANLGGATVVKVSTSDLAQALISKETITSTGEQADVTTYVLQDGEIPFLFAIGRSINATTTLLSNGTLYQSEAAALDLNQNLWQQITATTDTDELPLIQ